jgi:uncharacterized protein (TIGR02646 family)
MIKLREDSRPDATALAKLQEWQTEVNNAGNYAAQVTEAKKQFKARNQKRNTTFNAVKKALTAMCSGAKRCCYCEDSVADEVEHIHPKDFYPNLVFDYDNYLYACGNCNGPKSNRFEIFHPQTGALIDLKTSNPTVIPQGDSVLINPRKESGMTYFRLDLQDTFEFIPMSNLNPKDKTRAERTLDILHLNDREHICPAREEAFEDFKSHLMRYAQKKQAGATPTVLKKISRFISRRQHPSVWFEMKRYFELGWLATFDTDLHQAFEVANPEYKNW